jgi:hypothetical protein
LKVVQILRGCAHILLRGVFWHAQAFRTRGLEPPRSSAKREDRN